MLWNFPSREKDDPCEAGKTREGPGLKAELEGLRVQTRPVHRGHLALWLLPSALLDRAKRPYLIPFNLPGQRPEEVQRV